MAQKFNIISDGTVDGTRVTLNGEPLKKINSVTFSHVAGETPKLIVEFSGVEINLETTIVPELPKAFQSFYKKIDSD